MRLPELNDGHRLPGREGMTTPAAVLMPIVNRPEGLTLLLTQRSDALPDHPGQISFPGGRTESHDPTPAATARLSIFCSTPSRIIRTPFRFIRRCGACSGPWNSIPSSWGATRT